ncbi:autotransporter outer membrane beta-barrel domain-containing protein [Sphingomonas mesophila]|uniref:autotransporter outer membrane beta-barrel domain-containing protein n=1 Tax=Sphingomonas mesophila TaxID=2303576 RepID=UPI000E56BE4E|nr:autotransporter outer membrane beta-barrel domain-containing protein [Sphingomonas mesophila]
MNKVLRHALTGSAIATGMMVAASPASAQCTITPPATPVAGTVTCATTATTPTVYTGTSPDTDRIYNVDTSTTAFTGTVSTGAAITVNGLEFVNTVPGNFALNVVNNGSVSSSTGFSALMVRAFGATPVNYTGEGNVTQTNVASGHGLDFFMQGTGNLVATVGAAGGAATTISTVAPNSAAIQVNRLIGTAGATTITTTSDTTLQAPFAGINIDASGAGTQTVNNAATIGSPTGALNTLQYGIRVVENATGTGNIAVANTGAIGLATDRAQVNGILASNLNAGGSATVGVTGSGAIFSVGDGIAANTAGTGTVTVNYTGAINTTTGDGIDADSTTGNQSITVGGNITSGGDGINLTTTTGTKTITVAAGTTINSTAAEDIEVTGAGATTINNNGTIGATTNGLAVFTTLFTDGAVTVNNNAGGVVNGTFNLTDNADVVTNRGTINLGATTFLQGGNDTVTNLGGGVINFNGGTINFGAGATDTFANTGGTLNVLTNTTLSGLEVFTQTGRINFSAATTLTGPAIAFVNGPGSFIDTAGAASIAGFTSLTNSGTIDLAAGTFTVPAGVLTNTATGIIIADEGATTITGQTSFANNGTIDLSDGAIGDTLTVNSNYVGGNGSRLQVDVSGTTADTLVIVGAPTGQTLIDVNTVGLGVFDPDGILVVDATGASSGAFAIGEEIANPLINFDVAQIGNDYFLVTLLDPETAFVPLAATGLVREMWYQSADEVFAHTLAPTAKLGLSVWAQAYGSQRRTGMTNNQVVNGVQYDADNNIEIDRYGFQGGVGYGFGVAEVGLTGGYANAQANGDGEFNADGWNIGLYGRYGALTGFHAEALFKHDSYDMSFDGLFDGNDGDASSTGVDGSIGYRLPVGVVPSIDIYAGLSHVWSDMDGVSAFGFDYDFDDMTSTRGRLGVRGNFGGLYNPYLSGAVYHEFSGDGDVTITQGAFSDSLSSTGKGTWARLEGGLAGGKGTYGMNVAGWVDLGDTRGAGIRAGIRF